jgi:aminoglycoside 3-N-acetyltransferase I
MQHGPSEGTLKPTYRTLGSDDIATMQALLAMFGAAFEDHDSYQSAVPSDAYLARLLARDTFIAVVAEVAGRVVGGLAGYVLDKFEQERREFYIYDLAVDAEFRRRGIASGVIRELQRVAAERDVYVIFVQADMEDDPAIALYATFGSSITAHHFDIDVPPQPPSMRRTTSNNA